MRRRDLGEFLKYASQNVLGMLGLSCYILADTFFVAKGLGENGLAALNLAIPVYSFIHGAGLMFGIGGAVRYSISGGSRGARFSDSAFTASCLLTALAALVFLSLGIFLSERITSVLGADSAVFDMTNTYIKVLLIFAPAFLANDLLICFVRSDGGPGAAMAAMLAGSFFNILFDWIFIFPLDMGIFGAVLATGLSPLVGLTVLSVRLMKKRAGFGLRTARIPPRLFISVLSSGFSSFVAEAASGTVIIVFNAVILSLEGNAGVAAYGIVANISLVVMAAFTGVAQGIQPLTAAKFGAGDGEGMRRIFRYAAITIAAIASVVYLTVFFRADGIVAIFNGENNPLLADLATVGLKIYFIAAPFAGFNMITAMYLTSTNRPFAAQAVALTRGFVLLIPLSLLLARLLGITGVWLTFPATELAASFAAALCLIKIKRPVRRGLPRI